MQKATSGSPFYCLPPTTNGRVPAHSGFASCQGNRQAGPLHLFMFLFMPLFSCFSCRSLVEVTSAPSPYSLSCHCKCGNNHRVNPLPTRHSRSCTTSLMATPPIKIKKGRSLSGLLMGSVGINPDEPGHCGTSASRRHPRPSCPGARSWPRCGTPAPGAAS